jgi:hypothetical protein
MAELVQYECSRCGSRLQVLGQAQVWCRCGSPMQPVARDLNPMGMAQPARACGGGCGRTRAALDVRRCDRIAAGEKGAG